MILVVNRESSIRLIELEHTVHTGVRDYNIGTIHNVCFDCFCLEPPFVSPPRYYA